jgi:vitamin B12 transporter
MPVNIRLRSIVFSLLTTSGGAAALWPAVPAFAAGTSEDPLPVVVVTATRIETPVDEVIAPVVVIDRATIARSAANDTAELLRFHAGLDVARNGGPGQTTALFIRGAESNHTLVLVDGVRINPGTIGLPALQNIPPDLIERIEVVKGPRSALWGSDAIGGVVNIVTRRGSHDGWVAEGGYGDYDTRKASVNGGFDLGKSAGLDLGISWLESDGFPDQASTTDDRGFRDVSANLQLRATLGSADVALRHWRTQGNSEYSDFFLTPLDQDYLTSTTTGELSVPVGGVGNARVAVSHLEDRIEQNQSTDFVETKRDTIEAQFDWKPRGAQTFGIGASYSNEDADSISFGAPMSATTDSVSAYVQDRVASGPHLALLALGYTDHETAGSAVTWNAEYAYTFNDAKTRLYALTGAGFRAPDATDRYGFGGNPDLKPERSRNYEAGIRQAISPRQAVQLSAFQNDIEDLIEFVVTDFTTFDGINKNVDSARIRGLEASWNYTGDLWQARLEAIYQDPRDLSDDSRLLRRTRKSLTAALTRAFGPVQLGLEVLASGDRKDFGFPTDVTLDSYVLANLTAQWQATPSLAFVARVENLFDEQYELVDNYNSAGRGVYFTVRYAPRASAASRGQ